MRHAVCCANAPAAIGPYSQAIQTSQFVFISGQLPVNPKTNDLPIGIVAQTKQSLVNLESILSEVGLTMSSVVKTTVYLKNMSDFSDMNHVYSSFFPSGNYPARSAIEVAKLPKDALVEIEAIAILN